MNIKLTSLVLLSGIGLFGCASQKTFINDIPKLPIVAQQSANIKNREIKEIKIALKKNSSKKASIIYVPSVFKGSEIYSEGITSKIKKAKAGKAVKISVENMPINEFVKLMFGKVLKLSYFIGKNVENQKGKVTLKMTSPVPTENILSMISEILSRYGVNITKKGEIYFINSGRRRQKKQIIRFFIGRSVPNAEIGEKIGMIIPLYYVKASRYEWMIRQFALSGTGKVYLINGSNAVMIVDTTQYIKAAVKLIRLFDRPYFIKKEAVLIHLNYLLPDDFKNELSNILPSQGIPIASKIGNPGIILKPMPGLSSLFVVSPKKAWLRTVLYWKNKLDTISALGDQPRLFVFYPKNRRAKDLAKIFSSIGNTIAGTVVAKSKRKNRKSRSSTQNFSGIKVVVDEGRNALVIMSTPSVYQQVKSVLERLDTLPKQVFAQVTIAEVTLTGNLKYGIEWYLEHTGKFHGVLQTLGNLGVGASGLAYSITQDAGRFQAIMDAFAQRNLVKVLSSPSLIVMDNKEASINVGTEVPIVTSETTSPNLQKSGSTSLLRSIEYRNTGVILHIKPTIDSNGILTMDIHQEVSDAQTNSISPSIGSPLILTRDINTSVVLKSGSTLLLGGLIQKTKSKTVNKVPLLGDLPIIGNLFKSNSQSNTRTELIVEITPYIIPNIEAASKITENYKNLLDLFKNNSIK